MTSIKKAAILIATHNKAGVLNKCLEEISHVKGRELFDIFIIDNNSSDQNKRVTDNYKDINYLKEDKNYFC